MSGLFTLDAILALVVATSIILASVGMSARNLNHTDAAIGTLTQDMLTVSAKAGYLGRLIQNDASGIDEVRTIVGESLCFELEIRDGGNNIMAEYDTGCTRPIGYQMRHRAFTYDDQPYLASLRGWIR